MIVVKGTPLKFCRIEVAGHDRESYLALCPLDVPANKLIPGLPGMALAAIFSLTNFVSHDWTVPVVDVVLIRLDRDDILQWQGVSIKNKKNMLKDIPYFLASLETGNVIKYEVSSVPSAVEGLDILNKSWDGWCKSLAKRVKKLKNSHSLVKEIPQVSFQEYFPSEEAMQKFKDR